jgi:DMSO/TMAO reductase YedYZ molybdopterin-dependent catalytic subunit
MLNYLFLSSRCLSSPVLSIDRLSLTLFLFLTLCLPVSKGLDLEPPPITPNDEFFVLGSVPDIPADWTLDIEGEVEYPLSLSLDELKQYPQMEIEATLECNFSSGPIYLVSSGLWTGVSLNLLLEQAGLKPSAKSVIFRAHDGYWVGPFSLDNVMQTKDLMIAYGMNGETLPDIHGWPARMVLPGCTGNQWIRWLDKIEISSTATNNKLNTWPIHARIFKPEYNATVNKCSYTINGMVNAGEGKEITEVQVSTDNGETWESAEILNYFVPNVWKHWQYRWEVESPGKHTIFARVIDKDGNIQNENGLYGWWGYKVIATAYPDKNCADERRADINKDGYVDFYDYSLLANQWLTIGDELTADIMPIESDAIVDIFDLTLIADNWLAGIE